MLALPTAAPPAPRRQLFVGVALGCAAAASLLGGMLALWLRFRDQAISTDGRWVPKGVAIPGVASNVMLLAFIPMGFQNLTANIRQTLGSYRATRTFLRADSGDTEYGNLYLSYLHQDARAWDFKGHQRGWD